MPDADNNFGGSLGLDFRKWWRHVQPKNRLTFGNWPSIVQFKGVPKFEFIQGEIHVFHGKDIEPTWSALLNCKLNCSIGFCRQ